VVWKKLGQLPILFAQTGFLDVSFGVDAAGGGAFSFFGFLADSLLKFPP
jgi:hypothetical protein